LLKISEGKIGTANPLFSADVKRLDLAVTSQSAILYNAWRNLNIELFCLIVKG